MRPRSDECCKEVINLVRKYTGKTLVDARMADEMIDLIVQKMDRTLFAKLDRIYKHLAKQNAHEKYLKFVGNFAAHVKAALNSI